MIFQPIVLSFKVAAIATLFTFILGIFFARLLGKKDFPGRSILEVLIILPMVLPPSVTGYGLLVFFGMNGFFGKFLNSIGIQVVFSWIGAVIAAVVVSFPLMYQSAKGAFGNIDRSYERAARTLGAGEKKIFWTITLPLAWPGIVSGIVLSFSRAIGEFGATIMVAGNIPGKTQTIPLAIYFAVDSGDSATANTLVAVITIFSFVLIFLLNLWLKKKNYNEMGRVS